MKEWPGTDVEKLALLRAVKNNCDCTTVLGYTTVQKGCHELLIPADTNKWAKLIFIKRQAGRLLVEELGPQHRAKSLPAYTDKDINFIHQIAKW